VETALISLEERSLLVTKGAKDYFFLSTIVALVKARLWPAQAIVYKQQVVERILAFAQALFSRHTGCEHLGAHGMGNFKNNQLAEFTATPPMVPVMPTEFDPNGMLPPPHLGLTVSLLYSPIVYRELCIDFHFLQPPGEFDPFLEIFDWEDLTGMSLPC
jgi:hypothetical protein